MYDIANGALLRSSVTNTTGNEGETKKNEDKDGVHFKTTKAKHALAMYIQDSLEN